MRKVAVFFGGKSCENEISVLTGVFVCNVCNREKYTVYPVYIHTDGNFYTHPNFFELETFKSLSLKKCKRVIMEGGALLEVRAKGKKLKRIDSVDVVLCCLHGGWGESGGLAALAERNGVAYASPPLAASGMFMDKALTKIVAKGLNIPTVEYVSVQEKEYEARGAFVLKNIAAKLKYPVVIKPAKLGSSIGITLAKNEAEAKTGIETAFALDDKIVIERYLQDKADVNCAACRIKGEICVSPVEQAFGAGVYSFDEKYMTRRQIEGIDSKLTQRQDSGNLPTELQEKIRTYTKTLYRRMELTGAVRMDFLVSGGKAYLCEVNTVPGSLAYYLFCERVIDARNFVDDILEEALSAQRTAEKKLPTTGILKKVSGVRK